MLKRGKISGLQRFISEVGGSVYACSFLFFLFFVFLCVPLRYIFQSPSPSTPGRAGLCSEAGKRMEIEDGGRGACLLYSRGLGDGVRPGKGVGGCIYPPGAVPPSQANKDGPFLIFEPYQSRTRAVPGRTKGVNPDIRCRGKRDAGRGAPEGVAIKGRGLDWWITGLMDWRRGRGKG